MTDIKYHGNPCIKCKKVMVDNASGVCKGCRARKCAGGCGLVLTKINGKCCSSCNEKRKRRAG